MTEHGPDPSIDDGGTDERGAPCPPEVTLVVGTGSERVMLYDDPASATLDHLVEAARDGDHVAFEELVRRTHADTFALARRLVSDEEDARDVVQEAYLRAFRSIKKFRGDAQFSTWLYRITANCASTSLGRGRRHRHDELDEEVAVPDLRPEHDPVAAADAAMLRERLEAAIADLPPRLRAVVVLRDIYDLNHAEIAEELGITESAAKVRLHRARRKLRTQVFPLPGEEPVDGDAEEQAHAV
ncbi:MAG: putative polymerase ECF-subfamily sigma factor [Acidimicrobiales bacterium]|nr:putative polymerase ECF-subfamily sigma factor [Acidimicrobiales bacterium]